MLLSVVCAVLSVVCRLCLLFVNGLPVVASCLLCVVVLCSLCGDRCLLFVVMWRLLLIVVDV